MNAMEKLGAEIRRVTEIRGQYETLKNVPGVNAAPAMWMMDQALKRAIEANGSNDPVAVVVALRDLEGFTE